MWLIVGIGKGGRGRSLRRLWLGWGGWPWLARRMVGMMDCDGYCLDCLDCLDCLENV